VRSPAHAVVDYSGSLARLYHDYTAFARTLDVNVSFGCKPAFRMWYVSSCDTVFLYLLVDIHGCPYDMTLDTGLPTDYRSFHHAAAYRLPSSDALADIPPHQVKTHSRIFKRRAFIKPYAHNANISVVVYADVPVVALTFDGMHQNTLMPRRTQARHPTTAPLPVILSDTLPKPDARTRRCVAVTRIITSACGVTRQA